jgi:hypothetical protein
MPPLRGFDRSKRRFRGLTPTAVRCRRWRGWGGNWWLWFTAAAKHGAQASAARVA